MLEDACGRIQQFCWNVKQFRKRGWSLVELEDWPFADPPNVAVFTDKATFEGSTWICQVRHDADDGAWSFFGPAGFDPANAWLVSLKQVVQMDESVTALADLPLGWRAWRETPNSAWQRMLVH